MMANAHLRRAHRRLHASARLRDEVVQRVLTERASRRAPVQVGPDRVAVPASPVVGS